MLVLITAAAGMVIVPKAGAAGPAQYSAPEWWPLRGSHVVGCTNGNGCSFAGVDGYHGYWALDIEATPDSDIYAAGAGQVEVAVGDQGGNCDFLRYGEDKNCPDGSRGNLVRIRHDATGEVTTFYLHFSTVFVKAGDWVDQNTLLGKAGNSGLAAPGYVHLHFEVRHGLFPVDPVPLKACHGDRLASYPGELGGTSWSQVPAHRYSVYSDGTACEDGSSTTLGNGTSTTAAGPMTTTTTVRTTTTVAHRAAPIIGRADGYSVPDLTIFGGVPTGVPVAPTPSVTLASDASNSPQTARVPSGIAAFGPATIFSSGAITVRTAGSLGPGGSVTSSVDIQNVNASRVEVFTATSLRSTCTAAESGISGSTSVTGGIIQTSVGDRDVAGDEVYEAVPPAPGPNTAFDGQVESVGDSFRYIFNEQIANADGSLTVYAAHLRLLGPTAIGDVYVGRVDCGLTPAGAPTTSSTTTTTGPPAASTTSTTSVSTTTSTTTITVPPPAHPLPPQVSAQICRVLDGLPPLPRVSLLVEPYRLRFGCGPERRGPASL